MKNKRYKKRLKLKKKNVIKAIAYTVLIIIALMLFIKVCDWMDKRNKEMIKACLQNESSNINYCYKQIYG